MRKNIVAGNWKMNTTLQEGVALAKEIDAAWQGYLPSAMLSSLLRLLI